MKYILRYLAPYRTRILFGSVIKFAGTIMDLVLPWILAYLIDDIVPLKNIGLIVMWGAVMIIAALFGLLGNVRANRMASAVARDATRCIRHDLFDKIQSLSSAQVDAYTVPSLEARLTSDTYNLHQMIGSMQRLGFRAPILLVGGIAVSAFFQPILTLVIAAILPFIGFLVFRVSARGIPLYTASQKAGDDLTRVVRENVQGIRVIKALSREEFENNRFDTVNRAVNRRETLAGTVMATTNPLMTLFLNLGLTLVILVGAYCVNRGMFQCGKIIAFMSYFTIILNAMLSVSRMFVIYSKGVASAARIGEILDTPKDLCTEPDAPGSAADRTEGTDHIRFSDVSFSYLKDSAIAVSDINISVRRGSSLGILGATGSGKSTLIRLLMRFYDTGTGTVLINGKNIKAIPPSELYTMIGAVMQNDIIFEGTIEDNIRFGRNISHEDVVRAAETAQASDFINEKKEGYAHMLTYKGTNLSGGQKQRILIARALAGMPEILILDDSSSALDYKTDAELRKALRRNTKGITKIIVAQRVSAVMDCDEILVLEEGKIVGRGTDEELKRSCSIYREISESQMGGIVVA